MAINKEKNVALQITIPKEDAEQLEVLKKAFNENGIKVSKSDIMLRALRDYIRILVMTQARPAKETKEEAKEDKLDA